GGTPSTRERLAQAFHSEPMPTATTANALNIRVPITQCSLELLEQHWILGMGQPRVQPALDACYGRFGIPQLRDGSYSTHCQPLHWWIAFGLAGLAAFLVLFGVPLREAFRRADGQAVGFLLIIVLCCLTENVLARQWGVVLFAYVNALLLAGRRA
ncbi:MAG TPA: O-antigen ligase family protein, partial [Flavobacteriales bacterium]|nr:O-antigen ligase family protein [Flavobacteriales bacterium]